MNDKQVTNVFICSSKSRLFLFIKNKHVCIFALLKHDYKYFICNNVSLSIYHNLFKDIGTNVY